MRDKGLGDTIERVAKTTGIKKVVDTVNKITKTPCGCQKRKEALNRIIPYKNVLNKGKIHLILQF